MLFPRRHAVCAVAIQEMLLGNGIAVATHLFLRREEVEVEISVPFQKRLVSIFRRLVLSSLFLAVVNFFMAFCESEMSMLTLGSVQSFFNAILLNTSHALTKPLNRNGSVQLGFLSGALLPILTIPFTGFGPKSSLLSRLAFYLVPSSFCFLIGLLIWAYHRRVAMHLETAQTDDADADAPRNIADLAEAYKNFKVFSCRNVPFSFLCNNHFLILSTMCNKNVVNSFDLPELSE